MEDDEILETLRNAGPKLEELKKLPPNGVPDVPEEPNALHPPGELDKGSEERGASQPRKRPLHLPMLPYVSMIAQRSRSGSRALLTVMGMVDSSSSSSVSSSSSSSSSVSPSSEAPPQSSSGSSYSSFRPPPSSESSKNAITPWEDGGIGWICSEEPIPIFSDTMIIPVTRYGRNDFRGQEFVPDEFVESVKLDSIRVTSLMPDVPCYVAGRANTDIFPEVYVDLKKMRPWHTAPAFVTVRIEAIRRGFGVKWPKFSQKEMEKNNSFWALANEDLSSIMDHGE